MAVSAIKEATIKKGMLAERATTPAIVAAILPHNIVLPTAFSRSQQLLQASVEERNAIDRNAKPPASLRGGIIEMIEHAVVATIRIRDRILSGGALNFGLGFATSAGKEFRGKMEMGKTDIFSPDVFIIDNN